jgi:hypothetical protein
VSVTSRHAEHSVLVGDDGDVSVTWVGLALDLDVATLAPGKPPPGITLTSLQELGDSEGHRQLVYELNKVGSADIPERGAFFSFSEYVAHVSARRPPVQTGWCSPSIVLKQWDCAS